MSNRKQQRAREKRARMRQQKQRAKRATHRHTAWAADAAAGGGCGVNEAAGGCPTNSPPSTSHLHDYPCLSLTSDEDDSTGQGVTIMTDGLATIREVSQALRISVRQVYRIVAEGHLAIIKIGAATRIEWADVRAYLDRMKRRQRRR